MTQSAGSRVLMAIKPVVQAYEDVKKMVFGAEDIFLVKVRSTNFANNSSLFKTFLSRIGRVAWHIANGQMVTHFIWYYLY